MRSLLICAMLVSGVSACSAAGVAAGETSVSVRWLKPAEIAAHGAAPGAKTRMVSSQPDGTKTFALVLARGDDVLAALAAFAREQSVASAHFVAIGAVRDPEVGWFDLTKGEYKAVKLEGEQVEVLSLAGDIALDEDAKPIVHAHGVFGRSDASAWGGHLIGATASPTLEVFVTTFPQPLRKRSDPGTGLKLIDPSLP